MVYISILNNMHKLASCIWDPEYMFEHLALDA